MTMAKVGGGINPMHLTNDKHPFGVARTTPTPKRARMTGLGSTPAGEGDKISANSARKPVKGSINGPGVAK
jgi:hypothetical protein